MPVAAPRFAIEVREDRTDPTKSTSPLSSGSGHNLSVANGSFAAVEICAFNVDTLAG